MTHGIHKGPRRVLDDGCEECVNRAITIGGLAALDPVNIRTLGVLAEELHQRKGRRPLDYSHADFQAVENLRTAARIVSASGITEEVANGR